MSYPANEIVLKMIQVNFNGNIIPDEWYNHLIKENGRPHTNSIIILSHIAYWYRPIPIYDINGTIAHYNKKFKSDLLQKNYEEFETKFGFSKKQVRDALIFLENKKIIFREFRNIKIGQLSVNNIMYIGIHPEKLSEISNSKSEPIPIHTAIYKKTIKEEKQPQKSQSCSFQSPDWSLSFSNEQNEFLIHLLELKPEIGAPLTKNCSTWWIKHYGIDKIKIALQIYWKQVEKAKKNPNISMPKIMGAYIRKILETESFLFSSISESQNQATLICAPSVPNSNGTVTDQSRHGNKIVTTKTKTTSKISSLNKKINDGDWSLTFSNEQKNFLHFLLNIKPEKGDAIEKNTAMWWIKHFGIEKIKISLKVYWQQVEKAKINPVIPIPNSIGAYVRKALNDGTQPCFESDLKNKAFAIDFKKLNCWYNLTITEKYCRVEGYGKEWYYHLPESLFRESLKSCHNLHFEPNISREIAQVM